MIEARETKVKETAETRNDAADQSQRVEQQTAALGGMGDIGGKGGSETPNLAQAEFGKACQEVARSERQAQSSQSEVMQNLNKDV